MKRYTVILATLSLFTPAVVSAQSLLNAGQTFAGAINSIINLINIIIPVIAAGGIIFFFWGLIRYIFKSGDAKGRAAGREAIIWSLIGLFVIFSMYGILNFLSYNLNLAPPVQGTPILPHPNL